MPQDLGLYSDNDDHSYSTKSSWEDKVNGIRVRSTVVA